MISSLPINLTAISYSKFSNFVLNDAAVKEISQNAPNFEAGYLNSFYKASNANRYLVPLQNLPSREALNSFSPKRFSYLSIQSREIKKTVARTLFMTEQDLSEFTIDLSKKGVCRGMVQLFISRLFKTKTHFSNPEAHLVRVASDFSLGAPPSALLLHYFNEFRIIDSFETSSYLLDVLDRNHDKNEIIELIKNLPNGTFHVSINGKISNHSVALVKLSSNKYYLFDPNVALQKFNSAEAVYKLLKNYNSSLPAMYSFLYCDGKVPEELRVQGYKFGNNTISNVSENAYLTCNKVERNSQDDSSLKKLVLSIYNLFLRITLFIPHSCLFYYYKLRGISNCASKAARIFSIFSASLYSNICRNEYKMRTSHIF